MKFTEFTLDSGLQEGLAEAGYITCMPVQEQVLQNGLEGADLYVQSQTGTGKTAAYLVTILQRLASDPSLSGKKALIMVPTRELAVQVEEEARILGSCMKLKAASFYGGVGYGRQVELLKEGVDVLIGTPGRVIDLQESGQMDLSQVAFLVIDEADRMFDMGFYPDLRTLIKVLPKAEARQTMLFSATLNATVKNLAWEYTIEAKEITIEAENVTVDEIDQLLFHVSSNEKMRLLLGLLKKETPESLIVFCNTKRMSEIVAKRLKINGYEADFIIGDLPQAKRLQVIDSFKSGSLKMLVATDVAARGIDVDSLAMVINYDLPNEAENYVHRIGRTARAGKTGKAYSFCSEQDVYNLPAIEKYCESKIPTCVPGEDDFTEDKSAGTYIRTDNYNSDYDDGDGERGGYRGRGRPGDSRGRGPRSGSSDGRRSGDGRDRGPRGERPGERRDGPDSRRSGDGRRPGDGRRTEGARRFEDNRRNEGRRGPAGTGGRGYPEDRREQESRDLSKLSFEERMAYYKNKYGSEEAAKAAESQRMGASDAGERTDRNDRVQGGRGQQSGSRKPADRQDRSGENRNRPQGSRPRDGRGDSRNGESQTGERQGGSRNGSRNAGRQGQNRHDGQRPQGGRPGNASGKPAQGGQNNRGGKIAAKPAQGKQAPDTGAKKSGGIAGFFKKLFGQK
jgi:ATP-dependent RNA helicase RhlB